DEFRERLEHLPESVLIAFCEHGHFTQPELLEEKLAAAGVVEYVDDVEVYAAFRKKLFRSEAATSSRLGEVGVAIGGQFHAGSLHESSAGVQAPHPIVIGATDTGGSFRGFLQPSRSSTRWMSSSGTLMSSPARSC